MNNNNLVKYTITKEYSVKDAIDKMVRENIKAVVIVDEDKKVLGLFSNGDMRKYFLSGGLLSANIQLAMNTRPILYKSVDDVLKERSNLVRVIYPIVNGQKELTLVIDSADVNVEKEIFSDGLKDVPLVIMAGGKGTRLYPYTKILPKPLIPIGEKTITERIIDNFAKFGCNKVILILNHKANMIKAYFEELQLDINLKCVKEEVFLGTAGGLKLIQEQINSTFILSNCDILINDDLECAYTTHKLNGNKITFICCMKDIVIPYGVVNTDDEGNVVSMKEKPDYSVLINTGVYIVEPEVIRGIQEGEFLHMPDLAQRYINRGEKVGVFPVPGKSWLDMGQISEMNEMMQTLGV